MTKSKKIKPKQKRKKSRTVSINFGSDMMIALIIATLCSLAYFGLFFLSVMLDYFFNKAIIDGITASQVQWWMLFTFGHTMTWLFVYNYTLYITVHGTITILIFIVLFVYLKYFSD